MSQAAAVIVVSCRAQPRVRCAQNEEEGTPEQQASAPQPPRSAIAAAVQAAKAASGQAEDGTGGATGSGTGEPGTATTTATHTAQAAAAAAQEGASSAVAVVGIDVALPFPPLRSADDLATPFTNYTSGYKALLDYVWYPHEALRVVKAHPVPTEAQLGSFIPSPVFPSDHLAVGHSLRSGGAPKSDCGGCLESR